MSKDLQGSVDHIVYDYTNCEALSYNPAVLAQFNVLINKDKILSFFRHLSPVKGSVDGEETLPFPPNIEINSLKH